MTIADELLTSVRSMLLADNVSAPATLDTPRGRHREVPLCGVENTLPPQWRAQMMRLLLEQAATEVKDKSYQRCPAGAQVKEFLDALRWDGKPDNTLNTYEIPLAGLAVEFSDFDGIVDFCNEDALRAVRGFLTRRWGDADIANETKRNRTSIVRSFGRWCAEQGYCPYNPFEKIKVPPRKDTRRVAHPREEMQRLLIGQESLRDSCALGLFICLAFRKNDGRMLQIKDIDLTREMVYLRHRKGGRQHDLPIVYDWLRQDLYLHIQGEQRAPHEYLIYPKQDRSRPMDPGSFHRWFKRCLERAGVDDFPMHELRHTAADDIWRQTGNLVAAQQLLGHRNIETTRLYLHPTEEDLRREMLKAAASWETGE